MVITLEYKNLDYKKIGERIRDYRKSLKLVNEVGKPMKATQENLLAYMRSKELPTFGRNTLSDLENGEEKAYSAVSLEQWSALCSVFGCSIGHLLGEYEAHDYNIQFIKDETGLTEKAIHAIMLLRRNNQVDWGLDTLNYFLEHSDAETFLYYMTAYSTAGESYVDTYPLKVFKRDIFQMRLNDCIKEIADGITNENKYKPDYRKYYSAYLGAYMKKVDNAGVEHSLDEFKKEMEQTGLIFDSKLFEGRERNG